MKPPPPTPDQVFSDLATSFWLKDVLASVLKHDPVDALKDVEILSAILHGRLDHLLKQR